MMSKHENFRKGILTLKFTENKIKINYYILKRHHFFSIEPLNVKTWKCEIKIFKKNYAWGNKMYVSEKDETQPS